MNRLLTAALLGLLLPAVASAQVPDDTSRLLMGGNAGATFVVRGDDVFPAPALTIGAEWQVTLSPASVFGLVGYYGITAEGGPGQLAGLGARYYRKVAGGALLPGIGLGGFMVGAQRDTQGNVIVSKDTILAGLEVLLSIPRGDGDNVTAAVGYFPAQRGDDVDVIRADLRLAFN